MSWIAQRDDTLMTPLYLILSTVLSLVILLAVGIAILVVTNHREKLRIKNYSCADAQIRSKNAQKQEHRKMRKESDKMLYEVLLVIDKEASRCKNEVVIDTDDMEKSFKFNPETTKKRWNAVKESLRTRGFCIVPDTHHKENLIHISWMTSRSN